MKSTPDLVPGEGAEGFEAGAHREHSLSSLLELSNELSASLDLYGVVDSALFNIMGHFGSSRIGLWILPDRSKKSAVLLRCHGISTAVARGIGAVWTPWLLSRTDGNQDPVLVAELRDLAPTPGVNLAERNGIAAFAPVLAQGEVDGVVALGRRVGGTSYGPADLELLHASLNLLGGAIENIFLHDRMAETNRQLRRANDELEGLDQMKSQFLQNMNHELRTPLTIMIGYLETLMGEEEESPHRQHLQVVVEQAMKLEGMLLNLLDLSKLVKDKFDIRATPGDIKSLLESYFEDRRPGISAGLRESRFFCTPGLPTAIYDRRQLVKILDCLVDNAVKFTPQGAHIHLRAAADPVDGREWVRIDVEDDGPGIDREHLAHIFEPFRQVDGSTTRAYGGMGMGLALAKLLAEKMNGSLEVASLAGRGATFSLRLPAA